MGAQGILVRSAKHTAALAAGADVQTLLIEISLFSHVDILSKLRKKEAAG
jgi:hypothetical protein